MSELGFIVNPASRRGKSRGFIESLQDYLAAQLPEAEVLFTEAPGHATALAKKLGERGFRRIFSVGGDGTLNEVVNGVMALPKKDRPAVGVLAAGTGGDFSRRLRELASFPKDFSWLLRSKPLRIDLGCAWLGPKGKEEARYYINIADAGIAGEVVKRVNVSSKFLGTLEYLRSTVQAGWQYQAPRVKMTITRADQSLLRKEFDLLIALAANSRYFGGGMCIAPQAELNDGKLFFMICERVPYLTLLAELRFVYRKQRMRDPRILYEEGMRMELEALSGDMAIDLDGEYLRTGRVVFEVVPSALEILVTGSP